jgi:D-lactate dehydrogenase (cytochrome)
MLSPEIYARLQEIVGEPNVSQSESDRSLHSRDQSSHRPCPPDAVVWPASTEEVSAVVRLANEQRIPIVGWGAGSSIEGNPIPVRGGIVVDFRRMDKIIAIHEQDFQVTVQAGVFYQDMNKVLARHGLFFPPDPGANASIGGMIANNAAGTRTVKYGATRDNVLALQVVLADGTVIHTGSRAVKQSAGYDLTHLFTGSEGTLGLITEATLKLAPLPEHFSAITAAFPTVKDAADAVFGIIGAGLNPAALELLDEPTIRLLKEEADFDIPSAPNLFMEFHGATEAALREELKLAEEICRDCACSQFQAGLGRDAHNKLWEVRHHTFEIMVRHHPGQQFLVTDVAVPISRYPELVAFAADAMDRLGLPGGLVGHAGDGNLHTVNFFDENEEDRARVAQLNDELVSKALSLGGTCTGEHGVGIGKRKYMVREHGEAAVELMRQIKVLLDPNGILNPGKVV